jgi:hypothetical protein
LFRTRRLSRDEPGDGFGALWLSRLKSERVRQTFVAIVSTALILCACVILFEAA